MRKIFRIARREYRTLTHTKSFIIGLILAPIFMSGGFIVFKISEQHVDTTDKRVAVVDHSGRIGHALVNAANARNEREVLNEEGEKVKPAYFFELVEPQPDDLQAQRLALSNRVREGSINAFVEIGADAVHPSDDPALSGVAYHSENSVLDEVRRWIQWPLNDHLRKLRLADAGIEESQVSDLFHWINLQGLGLISVDTETGQVESAQHSSELEAVAVPMVMMMLMWIMIMMGAMPMLNAVIDEKSHRIAEVILGCAKPFEFMMGKIIGGIGVSLTAAGFYVVVGMIAVKSMGFGEYVPYHLLPWFFTYMLAAIVMMGATLAALGSACNDAKEAQSMNFPAMIPVIIPFFVSFPVLQNPLGAFATLLSLIPPFTPMVMVLRLSSPVAIPAWQPWVGLLGVIALSVIAVWAGGRIFRVGLLMQGQRPRLGTMLRWALRG